MKSRLFFRRWKFFKRSFDLIFAAIFVVILLPVFVAIAAGIKIDSCGQVFFRQKRVGKNGQIFIVFKFRSMQKDAEKMQKKLAEKSHRDGPLFKIKNDPRITKFGKILRKFSLDELPQLFNIFRGEMSFVGPRPHLPEEIAQFSLREKKILFVKPGLTGLAQVSGRSDLPFAREIELDFQFIEKWSPLLDLKILGQTFLVAARGDGD